MNLSLVGKTVIDLDELEAQLQATLSLISTGRTKLWDQALKKVFEVNVNGSTQHYLEHVPLEALKGVCTKFTGNHSIILGSLYSIDVNHEEFDIAQALVDSKLFEFSYHFGNPLNGTWPDHWQDHKFESKSDMEECYDLSHNSRGDERIEWIDPLAGVAISKELFDDCCYKKLEPTGLYRSLMDDLNWAFQHEQIKEEVA